MDATAQDAGRRAADSVSYQELTALLAAACRTAGYVYATLDLDGYRIGSMNAVLPVTPLPAPGGRGRSPRPAEQDNLATPTGG